MQSPFSPGDTVSVRGHLWRLRGLVDHGTCVALDLEPDGSPPGSDRCVLLYPFDRVARLADAGVPVLVSRRRWWRQLAARLLDAHECDALLSPVRARIDLLPYQLEPAMAMALHGIPRVLLADAVGLGKTIQAGIAIAELFARADAHRALIIVPAGLRDQWASELRLRFDLDADVIDSGALRALAVQLPRAVNPWTVPRVAITSMDFAKRAEVISGLSAVPWDIVVIDEAHVVTADSDRHQAISLLARRAPRLLLLTATPHSGDPAAFAALTTLGATEGAEPIVLFRRSRAHVGLAVSRRMRLLRVRLGAAEHRTLRVLIGYARRVWAHHESSENPDARLAIALLLKRALSSPSSLLLSVVRRRALLDARDQSVPHQLELPLDDETDASDEEPSAVLGARGLARADEERAWLDDIAAAAAFGAREHRKVRAVRRLLRRVHEPAIVFTEYRDTLTELEAALAGTRRCVCLHGGMDRVDREATLSAFSSGQADVLLATDAGGTGLNLHHRCRLVINLELPWNPVRLEQRIGRVDRIGQSRTVHAIQIVGRATPESRVLVRLMARFDRARAALGDEESAWNVAPGDLDTTEAMLGLRLPATLWAATVDSGGAVHSDTLTAACDLSRQAAVEAERLQKRRALDDAIRRGGSRGVATAVHQRGPVRRDPPGGLCGHRLSGHDSVSRLGHGCVRGFGRCVVTVVRRHHRTTSVDSRAGAETGLLAVFEVRLVDAHGCLWDEMLVPIHVDTRIRYPASRRDARALAHGLASVLPGACASLLNGLIAVRQRAVQVCADERAWGLYARDGAEDEAASGHDSLFQPGLFDRRAERAAHAELRGQPVHMRPSLDRLAATTGARTIALADPPRLAGLLILTR